jgi:hypothetical protein
MKKRVLVIVLIVALTAILADCHVAYLERRGFERCMREQYNDNYTDTNCEICWEKSRINHKY